MIETTFLIPAFNEEKSIGKLIEDIKKLYPKSKIVVIDNNSTDNTAKIAFKKKADVIFEKRQGKAHAIQKGFKNLDSKFLVMMDADNTYDPKDAKKLLKPLTEGDADLVLGSRLNGQIEKGAISKTNIIGNKVISFTATLLFHPVSDLCTGYWAFNRKVVEYLLKTGIDCSGFEVEAEMFIKVSKGKFNIEEVPINYKNRSDEAKLNSFRDGYKIYKTLISHKFF
jgi:glycosyltransferase involved in cell wall biosynthesis